MFYFTDTSQKVDNIHLIDMFCVFLLSFRLIRHFGYYAFG